METGNKLIVAATMISPVEVNCPFPVTRSRRSVDSVTDDEFIAKGFKVAVSNDGDKYSSDDTIIILDTKCVNCSKQGGKVICQKQAGYCLKDGKCYSYGESAGCYTCLGENMDKVKWEAGPDCPIPTPPEKEQKTWLIAAIVGPVAGVIIISIILICCCAKKNGRNAKEKVGSMYPIAPDINMKSCYHS